MLLVYVYKCVSVCVCARFEHRPAKVFVLFFMQMNKKKNQRRKLTTAMDARRVLVNKLVHKVNLPSYHNFLLNISLEGIVQGSAEGPEPENDKFSRIELHSLRWPLAHFMPYAAMVAECPSPCDQAFHCEYLYMNIIGPRVSEPDRNFVEFRMRGIFRIQRHWFWTYIFQFHSPEFCSNRISKRRRRTNV